MLEQSTDSKMLSNKEGSKEDTGISLWKRNRTPITGGWGRPGWGVSMGIGGIRNTEDGGREYWERQFKSGGTSGIS